MTSGNKSNRQPLAVPHDDLLPMWVIYRNPSDYPGKFVVRRHLVGPGFLIPDALPTAVSTTINEARAAIPRGRIKLHRAPADDPCITEVWI